MTRQEVDLIARVLVSLRGYFPAKLYVRIAKTYAHVLEESAQDFDTARFLRACAVGGP